MIKKILLSLALLGFIFGSPILANAQSFTSLKAQLFDLSDKLENFKKVEGNTKVNGEVLGASSLFITSFTATPSVVAVGGTSTISWTTENVTSCTAFTEVAENNDWKGSKPISGTQVLQNITIYESYHLMCIGNDGSENWAQLYIYLESNLPDITFTATPNKIPYGGSTTLNWKLNNPTLFSECTSGGRSYSVDDGGRSWDTPYNKGLSGSQVINNLTGTSSFGLYCKNFAGGKSVFVNIDIAVKPKIEITANPIIVEYGGSTKLNWTTSNAANCKGEGDWSGHKIHGGSQVISSIKNDKTFILTCASYYGGSYSQSVKVKVKVINPNDKDKAEVVSVPDDTKITTTTDSNTCSFTFKKALAYGSKDSKSSRDVALMQSVLVDEGLLSAKEATGVFYAKTQTALKNFQKRYNLSQTGKLDTKTADKMNTLFAQYCAN